MSASTKAGWVALADLLRPEFVVPTAIFVLGIVALLLWRLEYFSMRGRKKIDMRMRTDSRSQRPTPATEEVRILKVPRIRQFSLRPISKTLNRERTGKHG